MDNNDRITMQSALNTIESIAVALRKALRAPQKVGFAAGAPGRPIVYEEMNECPICGHSDWFAFYEPDAPNSVLAVCTLCEQARDALCNP